ncbi:MAG: MFS transporter [Motilibacteraceae bacterium]
MSTLHRPRPGTPGDGDPDRPDGLTRDRLTWLVYLHLAVYGWFLYGFTPAVPLLRDDQGTSNGVSGLHGTALAAGAVVAGLVGQQVIARVGRGGAMRLGLAALCAGVLLFTLSPALPGTLMGALVAGTGGSLVVNVHSPVLTDHHELAGPAAIGEANALAAATGILSPLVLGAATATVVGWRGGLLVTVVLAAVVLTVGTRTSVPAASLPTAAAGVPAGRLPRPYWAAWTVLVLCISVEFSMTIWSSDLLRSRVGFSAGAAAAGVTAIVAGMTAGRFTGSRLALAIAPDRLLLAALLVTAGGFAVFWSSTVGWLSLAGLVVTGLGIAMQFPLGIARAIAASGGRPDAATSRASLGAGLAIGLGPFVLGALADHLGTHRAFLLVPALLAAAATVLLASTRRRTPSPSPNPSS